MTINTDIRAALRAQLLTVQGSTLTGTDVAVTTTGYHRATGDWTDLFAPGDEITVGGAVLSGNNGVRQVTAITASDITVAAPAGLAAAAAGPSVTIATNLPVHRKLQGRTFDEPVGKPWIRETIIESDDAPYGIGAPGLLQLLGIARYDLFYSAGVGTLAIERMAHAVKRAFKPGTRLVYGTTEVRTSRSGLKPLQEGDPLMKPVEVRWFVFTPNV